MRKGRVHIVTLGCSKNLVDSEKLIRQLEANGLKVDHNSDIQDAEIAIINTCSFILDAKQESVETILNFIQARQKGKLKYIYVMGCLSERYRNELIAELPEIDGFYGVYDHDGLINSISSSYHPELRHERTLTTLPHYAYLKISEGCDRKCSFCAIPLFKGKHHSYSIETLVKEAQYLAGKGVKELILIAQDLTYYGKELYGGYKLPELLEKLTEIKGIKWIRLHYAFPANFPDELLSVMKNNPKICNYLDIPFQHISNPMLKIMRRGITREQTYTLIEKIRRELPGVALRTSLLVGHPGETEQDFEELKKFVIETRFDRLGVFRYSHEEDTFAWKNYKDDIPARIKREREEEIMKLQGEISLRLNKDRIHQIYNVLIDRIEGEYTIGRTAFDSPEVDGEVLIDGIKEPLKIGSFYPVKITDADEYDLFGQVVP